MKKRDVLIVTIALFISEFMSAVEGTIVSTAMPTIVGDLHGVSLMNWVFSIFLLTNAIATPIYGKLADQLGRKSIFIFGLVVFIIGSLFSGLSNSMIALIIWRGVQGVGAGVIMPVSFTIIADMYPVEKRAQIMGINGSAWGIASVIAPLLGGFIVDYISWHWIFFINIPIGLVVIALIAIYLHEPKRETKTDIDIIGVVLIAVFLLAVMYLFQIIGQPGFSIWMVVACLVVSVVTGFLFIKQEQRAFDPLIPIKMFSNRTFVIQNLIAALVSGFIFGYEVYLPDWTQGIQGLAATMAGFAVTPTSVLWIVGSFISGRMLVKYRPQHIMNVSLTFIVVGAIWLVFLPITTPFWLFFVISSIMGVGFGITITTTTVSVQNSVAPEHIGVASSFNTLARTLGQTLMISIFGIVMNNTMARGVAEYSGTSMKMMNTLINPQTAINLSAKILPALKQILYMALHNIFIVALLLIVISYIVNWFDHKKTVDKKTS